MPRGKDLQIWTQGQGKYTSYWLPSFDDTNEKLNFGLDIDFDKDYTLLSNAETFDRTKENNSYVQ